MVRYYLLNNRIIEQGKDENGEIVCCTTKEPLFMKKYPYLKIAFNKWATQGIVQTWEEVPEAKELTLEEAQKLIDKWFDESDQKPYFIDLPDGKKDIVTPAPAKVDGYLRDEFRKQALELHEKFGEKNA